MSCLPADIKSTLYVDDLAIYAASTHMPSLTRRIQIAVNRLHKWSVTRGFKFSTAKSVVMHFTKLRGTFLDLEINLGNEKLKVVREQKFLGLILDTKLTWVPHFKYLRIHCMKTMRLMKTLSRLSWGADRMSLIRIYRALIRSKLDYGCQIYDSATKTSLNKC